MPDGSLSRCDVGVLVKSLRAHDASCRGWSQTVLRTSIKAAMKGFRQNWRLQMMKSVLALAAVALTLGQEAAVAKSITTSGPDALALAAVVGEHSPLVRGFDERVLRRLFAGNTNFGFTPGRKISVTADSIECRTGHVDITMRTCDLTFSVGKRALRGRQANELSATAAVAGATSEGAAGSSIESFSKLKCTIDPNEIMQKAGGGAQCTFETGQ
jgi:hypothetical protein